jgi:DNA-binding MarR family transcriptional regulator
MPSDTQDADIDLTPGTAKSDIVVFLYNNPGSGFSAGDIQDRLDIACGTVKTTLTRLNNDGLVRKNEDGDYYALGHRGDLRRYVGSLNQLERMFAVKNYDEHTNIDRPQLENIDEDELDAELTELEAELNQE